MKIVSFMSWCEKYSANSHGTDEYAIRHLNFAYWLNKANKPTKTVYNLSISHVNNSYITTPNITVIRTLCGLFYVFTLNTKTHIFLTIYVSINPIHHQKQYTIHNEVRSA